MLNFTRQQFIDRYEMQPMAHHMTSIQNLSNIFTEGALLSYAEMRKRAINYDDLSMDEVQLRRAQKMTSCNLSLHEYVPLYYSYKTPMAAKRQDRNYDCVYLTFGIEQIARSVSGIVISDGNASADATILKDLNSIDDFSILNKMALYSTRYASNPELGRKKSAELLVPGRLPLDFLIYISAIDQATIARVEQIVQPFKRQHFKCQIKPGWYFTDNTKPEEGSFFT